MDETASSEFWPDIPFERRPLYWYLSVREPLQPRHQEICVTLLAEIDRKRPSTRGLSKNHRRVERDAVAWFIEGLFQSFQCIPSVPLGLPLRRNYYTRTHRIRVPFPYKTIIRICNACERLGWIRLDLGNEFRGEITRIWPTGDLMSYFLGIPAQWFQFKPQQPEKLIMMTIDSKKAIKRVVSAREHPLIKQWRQNLFEINRFLCAQCIYLDIPDEQIRTIRLSRDGQRDGYVWFSKVELRRVFNSDRFDYGGRFYGGWWQMVPKEFRPFIRINGEPTIEIDFKGMAIRSLYAREGEVPPDDPYSAVQGQDGAGQEGREARKRYTTAALNDMKKRHRAPKSDLRTLGLKTTKDLRNQIIEAHPFLEPWLHSGVGVEMQHIDSVIAEHVMMTLFAKGITCLPVHDSFIVMKSAQQDLLDAMMTAYQEVNGIGSGVTLKEGVTNQGVWSLPEDDFKDDAAILSAWDVQLNERYRSAHSYYESWVLSTKTPEQIDQEFSQAWMAFRALRDV